MAGSLIPPDWRLRMRRDWWLLAIAVVAVLLLLLLGLTRLGPSSPSASPSTISPYAQLFSQVRPDGTVSEETALEAFALAIAPLPGVTPPTGAPPTMTERLDGTFAIDWLRPYLADLTDAQRAAVDAALAPDPNAPVVSPNSSGSGSGIVLAGASPATPYVNAAAAAQPVIAAKLGRSLHLSWSVTMNATQEDSDSEFAVTHVVFYLGYGAGSCSIHVNPLLANSTEQAVVNATMAHELFHCFQYDWFDQNGGFRALPQWIIEGQAEWAGEAVGGPSTAGRDWWGTYLTTMDTALWQRTYDAIGFYQHLSEEGVDPWKHFDAMLATTSNSDAYKAAGATDDTFLDTWASGLFRDAALGPAWKAQGPWTTSAAAVPHLLEVASGQTVDLATNPVVNQDNQVTSTADIVEIRMQGHVRLWTNPDTDETSTTQRWLCTKDGGCACPTGEHYAGPDFDTVDPTFRLGLTGSLSGASGTLTGHDLSEFCKLNPSQEPNPPGPCPGPCPGSNGDPHLATVNHYKYDFQAAGEFVLLRSSDDRIEIQGRQEPFHQPSSISTNTAIAARDAGHRIAVYAANGSLTVKLDGNPIDPTVTTTFGGGQIAPYNKGFEIDFPDGTRLWTLAVGDWGINAVISPSAGLAATGVGLLGTLVPGGMGVPALPDGTRLPIATSVDQRNGVLYGQFADAWRVTDSTTLFDYDPGKSTATYTIPNFPLPAHILAPEELTAAQLAAGEAACAGVTDQDLNEDCVYDVAVTGEAGFADGYAAVVYLYDSGIISQGSSQGSAPPPSAGPLTAVRVADVLDIMGAAVAPDDTLYVSVDTPANTAAILAIDPHTGTVTHQITVPRATDLHFVAGALFAPGVAPDASGGKCTVSRFDPVTLASQATVAVPCTFGYPGPKIVSSGSALWYEDTSHFDGSTGKGANMVRIDPASGAPGASVSLPENDGCCQDGQGAIYCYCGGGNDWQLADNGSAFQSVGNYTPIYPAASGFWTEQGGSAVFVSGTGGPTTTIPLQGNDLVGGDATGFYFEQSRAAIELFRQPADGSPPTQIATAPTFGVGLSQTSPDYLIGGFPTFATADGFAHYWIEDKVLYLQWAPLH